MTHVDSSFKSSLTTISIGPGIRGIERGISRVTRLREIAFVEIEAFVIENMVAEMEKGLLAPALIWSDAKTFPAHFFRGIVDLLLAGYPCQPFSNAGARKGTDDPRHLFPYIERTIDAIRPKICFFENVKGHVTLGLREVIESLEQLGYRVHWGIFSAEETGASHKRERVFILAIRKDVLADNDKFRSSSKTGSYQWKEYCKQWSGIRLGTVPSRTNELAYSNNNGERTRPNNYDGESKTIEGEEQRKERDEIFRERSGAESSLIGIMGNANDSRLQGWNSEKCGECTYEWITGPNGPFGPVARPGQPQHSWESPRTTKGQWETKSGMGGRVNGYKFREDFLRALGNSVYADTAELAWITLWNKF